MNIKNNYFITTIALTVAAVAAFEDNANTKALKGEAINNLFLPQVRGSWQLKKEQEEGPPKCEVVKIQGEKFYGSASGCDADGNVLPAQDEPIIADAMVIPDIRCYPIGASGCYEEIANESCPESCAEGETCGSCIPFCVDSTTREEVVNPFTFTCNGACFGGQCCQEQSGLPSPPIYCL